MTAAAQVNTEADAGTKTAEEQAAAAKATQEVEAKAAQEKAQQDLEVRVETEVKKRTTPPDKYEFTVPDGSLLEPAAVERIAAYAKAQGLSQTQAQALVERESAAAAAIKEGQVALVEDKKGEWMETAKTDKEIGGDMFPKNAELAKRVVARYFTDAFKEALENTGLGNHPELMRGLVRIGKSMTEDQLVLPGAAGAKTPKDPAEILYGEKAKT